MASKGNTETNYVHQNAILCETIKKEQRNHQLYTNYSINPFKKSKLLDQQGRNVLIRKVLYLSITGCFLFRSVHSNGQAEFIA